MFIARWNLEEAGGKCTSQGTRTGFEAGIADESLMHNEIRSRKGIPVDSSGCGQKNGALIWGGVRGQGLAARFYSIWGYI
ncbi:hypothetical protein PPYC1_21375 [Paenibacillus polymyxa]|uniref:hypothetical protein n=1 Tax=Paenibacillus polymyxa TaxID=1406 RepID=UPI0008FC5BB9|nr:hypothetical protein [Paenibacillus polymyxa]APB72771.1 hypothetical protein PPYC1_21375 [Paenibacillus polymyxa]